MLPSLILSSLLVCACGASLSAETRPFDVAPTAHRLTIDNTGYSITLTPEEANNNIYPLAYEYMLSSYNESQGDSTALGMFTTEQTIGYYPRVIYGETTTEYIDYWTEDFNEFADRITFYQNGEIKAFNNNVETPFSTYDVIIDFSDFYDEINFPTLAEKFEQGSNPSTPSGAEVVTDIVSILVSGLTTLGTGIGSGVANFAQALAFDGDGLSVYFVLVLAFAGVSLAVGLTTKIFDWLSSLGN